MGNLTSSNSNTNMYSHLGARKNPNSQSIANLGARKFANSQSIGYLGTTKMIALTVLEDEEVKELEGTNQI